MFNRVVVFATIACLGSATVEAQAPSGPARPRIRITGARVYEVPGVLTVDGNQVSGRADLTTDDLTVHVMIAETGQQLVALKPGTRFFGRALDVRDRVVVFLPDGQQDTIAIPLESIGTLEVSEHRGRRRVLLGILVGVGAFYGTAALIFFGGCGLDCSNAIFVPAIASGVATGALTGRRREAWKTMTISWLSAQFMGTSHVPSDR